MISLNCQDGSYSVSDIKRYVEWIIKKHETLPTHPPIHNYINRIISRLKFKIKDAFKLELQTPEIMKLLCSSEKLIDRTKNGEK